MEEEWGKGIWGAEGKKCSQPTATARSSQQGTDGRQTKGMEEEAEGEEDSNQQQSREERFGGWLG
jgi:hypothetical protein